MFSDVLPYSQFVSQLSCGLDFDLEQGGDLLPGATTSSTWRWGAHVGRRAIGIWGPTLEEIYIRAMDRGRNTGVGPRTRPRPWGGTFVGIGPLVRWRTPEVT